MLTAHFLFKGLINIIIPARCLKCGDLLRGDYQGLCTSCWPLVPFIANPQCAACGLPFSFEIEEGALCGQCSLKRPAFKTARAAFAYTPESRDLILKFKHTDNISSAFFFASLMAQVSNLKEGTLCLPVPLHWSRLFMRTYNQAALLAQNLAPLKKWTYSPTLLQRGKRTPSQGRLSKEERFKNLKNAFFVPDKKKALLKGKTIVLVDDVYTSGATLEGCTKALLKAGVEEVHALTLSRVVPSS